MSPADLYTKEERRLNGVFYTPPFLAVYLAKKIINYYGNRKINTVIDPACGTLLMCRKSA